MLSNNWATPADLFEELDKEFDFTFDPCPMNGHEYMDGLKCEWGKRNFVNPPYSYSLKKKFVMKALEEKRKGRKVVLLLPVSTSTRMWHELIVPNAKEIRFLKGRLAFQQFNEWGEALGTGKDKAPFDSVLVVL